MRLACLVVVSACGFSARTNPVGDDVAPGDGATDSSRVRPPAGPCGKVGAIADDFADGTAGRAWIVTGAPIEAARTLAVTPTQTEFAGYTSDPMVDLRDAAAEVEVKTMVAPVAGGPIAFFRFTHAAGLFGISVQNGMIAMGVAPSPIVTLPYDPIAHRHWRVSHANNMLAFSFSPDAESWTTLHTAPAPSFVGAVAVGLGAANPNGTPDPGTVTFADFSTYVAPAVWCPAQTLSDGFDGDATIGLGWARHGHSSTGCLESEGTTAARVDQNGTTACDAFYGASTLYALQGSEIVVRITAITQYTTGWLTYLGAWDLEGRFARLYFEENMMCADGTGITKTCTAYSTARDLWRIREAGGTLYFETAPSGGAYVLVHSLPTPFPTAAVRPFFGTRTDRAINQSIGLSVDRFN